MNQVRYFLAICETLNFTRAAEQCNVGQPALTRAIKKLEDELGGPLIRRERNQTHLTELGNLVRPHLEAVITADSAAQLEARRYLKLEIAPLTLGVMCTIGPARLIGFLEKISHELPNLELRVREAPGEDLLDTMLEGDIDVALIGLPEYPKRCRRLSLYDERYVVAFPKGHRFETQNAVPVDELDGEDYLARSNCEFGRHYGHLGFEKDFAVNIRYRSEREDWIQAMVLAGMGCAIMPEFLATLPGIASRVLVAPEVSRTVSLIHLSGRRFTPAVAAVERLARAFDWEQMR